MTTLLLAAGMLLSGTGVLPVPAMTVQAAEAVSSGTCGEHLTWTLDDTGTLTISGTGNMTDFENNLAFPWSNYVFQIRKAVIEDGVTSIGDRAFYSCYMMTSVTIPESVTKIGFGAVDLCTGLKEVTIPDSVSNIGNSAFFGCDDLTDITILNPDCGIYDDAEAISDNTVIHGYAGSTAQAYAEKYSRTFEVIGDAPEAAASGTCGENLTWTLDSEGTLTVSGTGTMTDYAYASPAPWYEQRESIKNIVIEDGVTDIHFDAFSGCNGLTSVTIPKSIINIRGVAFFDCHSSPAIEVDPENSKYSDEDGILFSKAKTTIIRYPSSKQGSVYSIPNSVQSIGDSAFWGCKELTSITIPNSVTSIGKDAFFGCRGLTNITIPTGVSSISYMAFSCCSSITSITIPNTVTNIDSLAFDHCTGLTSITIPDSVTSIGKDTFFECTALTDITVLNPECEINNDYLTIPEPAVIHGYAGSTAQAYAEKYNRTFEVIGDAPEAAVIASGTCGENLTWTLDDAGTLTVSGTGNMTDYANDSPAPWKEQKEKIKAAVIEPGVTGIGHSAFDGCKNLASVTIPEGVTSIADSAFYGCSGLTSVTIPDSVTAIERLAFQGCSGLTEIKLPDGVTGIGNYAFYGCSGLTAFTVPESVTDIGQNAFAFCGKLAEITIPASVKTIGPCVFIDCTDLKTITLLNPDCEIDYSEYTRMVPKTTVIRGYEGSSAQTYADFFGQTFEAISASAPLIGDPDGDGAVTNKDAQKVLVAYTESLGTGKVDLPEDALKAADVNGDGKVGVDDAQYILIYYTGNTIAGNPTTWEDLIQ